MECIGDNAKEGVESGEVDSMIWLHQSKCNLLPDQGVQRKNDQTFVINRFEELGGVVLEFRFGFDNFSYVTGLWFHVEEE